MSERPGLWGLAVLGWILACQPLNSVALSRPEYLGALALPPAEIKERLLHPRGVTNG